MEKSSLLLKLKACAAQLFTLFKRLDWKTSCLMHIFANQLRSNERSLSWMDLTRERRRCAGRYQSRLNMNTCQTSIKDRYINAVLWYSASWVLNILEITIVGPQWTNLSGEGQANKQNISQIRIVDRLLTLS